MDLTDQELLESYRRSGDDAALQALIRRHLNLVYSAALRLVRDRHLAEDVVQVVFIIFSRKAAALPPATILAGWLYRTTRYAAANAMKSKSRRERYEQLASRPEQVEDSSALEWDELAPHVDQALAEIRASYRDAILLRFFRGMSLAAVGQAMGISEEAARKLVDRGVTQLRARLMVTNLACTDAVLMAALASGAAQQAPAHLASLVAGSIAGAGAGAGASGASLTPLIKGTLIMMTWTKTNIAIAAVAAALLISIGATTVAYSTGAFSSGGQSNAPSGVVLPAAAVAAAQGAPVGRSVPADAETTREVRKIMDAVLATTVAADRKSMAALSFVESPDKQELADAGLETIIAGKALRDALTTRFGTLTTGLESMLPGGPKIFREQYVPSAPVTMEGELAVVPINPNSLPQAMSFRKVDGQWRLAMGATFGPTPEVAERQLRQFKAMSSGYQRMAQEVAAGNYESQDQVQAMLDHEQQGIRAQP